MGTNYYARVNHCDKCNRGDDLHIGKSSFGWKFSFRGHRDHAPPLTTEQAWRDFLREHPIFDEYGDRVEYDEFWKRAINKERSELRDHIDYLRNGTIGGDREYIERRLASGEAWHDDKGNSFLGSEFS
jgi:hypothetical protein